MAHHSMITFQNQAITIGGFDGQNSMTSLYSLYCYNNNHNDHATAHSESHQLSESGSLNRQLWNKIYYAASNLAKKMKEVIQSSLFKRFLISSIENPIEATGPNEDNCYWYEWNQKLRIPRHDAVAFLIPDDVLECK